MKKNKIKRIELLAPARNADIAIAAIRHGADAVYIGSEGFGARAAAANSVEEIKRVVDYAHLFHAKVYVTFNTLVYENELQAARDLVSRLYEAGVDALIVQDMSLLMMDIPPIQLHASTQADIRTPEKALFLQNAGFSQLVLPREMTAAEIKAVSEAVEVPLEVFVHGALCVSYSGACRASYLAGGRSANRGECAQMCRQSYNLEDKDGNIIVRDKYLLSLKDMNRMDYLEKLLEAGATSFKIEGRLKDEAYVKNVVGAYRRAIDRIIESNPEKYCRSSIGETRLNFKPSVEQAFNRGFTPYFLDNRQPVSIASIDTPKSIGACVGKIKFIKGNTVFAKLTEKINNGDGLGFFDKSGKFTGFRANRVEGDRIFTREPLAPVAGNPTLYRNRDTARDAELSRNDTATRTISVDGTLRLLADNRICLSFQMDGFQPVETILATDIQTANKPVAPDSRKMVMEKLGDTIFRLRSFADEIPCNIFIPNSRLATLRREAVENLLRTLAANRPLSLPAERKIKPGEAGALTAENVANSLAAELYRNAGSENIVPATETLGKKDLAEPDFVVMECRYCIRRELGACLKKSDRQKKLPVPLYLKTGNIRYRLDFNCTECMMKVIANPK